MDHTVWRSGNPLSQPTCPRSDTDFRNRSIEQGTFICGSPQTVIDQLAECQRRGGFNIVMAGLHFGTLPHELTMKALELFAREVMPALKGAVPGETPRVAAAE